METFEFVVTSIARVALKEHVKIQAEGVEDAITRIEDNDYYEEDGEILSREYELIDYESTEDIYSHGPNSIRNLWRRLIFQSTYQIGKVLQL